MTLKHSDTMAAVFDDLLPGPTLQVINDAGDPAAGHDLHRLPNQETLLTLYAAMVIGRTVETAATALAKQGTIAAYPSARGQEACQVGTAATLAPRDWLFPTYRDSIAVITRGVDPIEALAGPLGHRHAGYDPYPQATAPMCTPLATHAPHAVGFAHAARYRGEDTVALVLLGDGATSEGDFHAALNFAAVLRAPVVFVIQNNQYAISTPAHRQSAAPSLAHKGIGYGIPAVALDGNDVLAVHLVVAAALQRARNGAGPALIEAITYRAAPHTTSDDPSRYRTDTEVDTWRTRDPLTRYATYLTRRTILTEALTAEIQRSADAVVAKLRLQLDDTSPPDPRDLIHHVYAEPPATLLTQVAHLEDADA